MTELARLRWVALGVVAGEAVCLLVILLAEPPWIELKWAALGLTAYWWAEAWLDCAAAWRAHWSRPPTD